MLAPLLRDPAGLETVLMKLRREHQNPDFWNKRQDLPWMQCPPPLEALRRFHVEQGYVAPSQDPLASLQRWGSEAVLSLIHI